MRLAHDLAPNAKPAGFPVMRKSCAWKDGLATRNRQCRQLAVRKEAAYLLISYFM
jgi:hypothetical protein